MRHGLPIFLLGAAIIALVLLQVGIFNSKPVHYKPWPVPPPQAATVDIGATTLPLARNSWRVWQPSDLETINAFEHVIRKHASIVMWYEDWEHGKVSVQQLRAVARRGSIPEITWEPWNSLKPITEQPRYRLSRIIAGEFDPYIRTWAQALAAYGGPVRLRFAQEMNGVWYPWSEHSNGNHVYEFARTWRHIHDIFQAYGATNVQWVWSPAAILIPDEQYPGDAYVDMVSLSVFNGGQQLRYAHWRSLTHLLRRSVGRLHAIAPSKAIELSEIGSGEKGGSKPEWVAGVFDALRRYPAIKSVVWYNMIKGTDWRVESSQQSAEAFANGVAAPRYR